MNDRDELIADEILIIRDSGEIPEVALHGSLHYLTRDPEGPLLALNDRDMSLLRDQVVQRYRDIILRDLTPENRDKSIYRGLQRCVANWQRLCLFCGWHKKDMETIREETAAALLAFIEQEARDVASGGRQSSVNCSSETLKGFVRQLGIAPHTLPPDWQSLCL